MRLIAAPSGSEHFHHVLTGLQSIAERSNGDMTVESLTLDITHNKKQSYVAQADDGKVMAVAVTEVYEMPSGEKAVYLVGGTGEAREEWQHLITELCARAKANGCVKFKSLCRPGWVRAFKGLSLIHI